MSLRINNNVESLNAHRHLINNDKQLSKSIERLSSGQKINRGADGPASLVISEGMRAQIGSLQQALSVTQTWLWSWQRSHVTRS